MRTGALSRPEFRVCQTIGIAEGAANRSALTQPPNGDDPQARQGLRVAKGFSDQSDALFSDNLACLSTSSVSRLWTFAPMWRGSPKGEDREEGSS